MKTGREYWEETRKDTDDGREPSLIFQRLEKKGEHEDNMRRGEFDRHRVVRREDEEEEDVRLSWVKSVQSSKLFRLSTGL